MSDSSSSCNIGEIVEIVTGRDKGNLAIVLGITDERFVLLADGDKRKFDNPKRKNIRHIKTTGFISKEIINTLEENSRVSNAKLRYVLQDFISNHLNEGEKGD